MSGRPRRAKQGRASFPIARRVPEKKADLRAENEALRAAEKRLRTVVDNTPVVLFALDQQGRFTLSEGKGLAALGLQPGQVVGQSALELYRDSPSALAAIQRALAGEEFSTEVEIDGLAFEVWYSPVRNAAGDLIGTIGVATDITERRRVEKALRDSRDLLRTVLDTIPARVFWKDLDLRYLGCNVPFARDAGLDSPEQMIGKDDYQMGWREQAELYRSDDRRVLESGVPKIHYEEPQTTPDGRRLWLRTSKAPLRSAEGVTWGVLGTYEDITERKQAEAERERLIQELEMRNAELERFTYTVSHDLKSPLITMNGFLGFLEKDALAGNTEGLKADIARIRDATGKMDRLLRELLELSRIGRMMNAPERLPFEDVAREAVGLAAGRLRERGIRAEIAAGMPVVSGDRVRLVEVVQNLLENASKFMGSQPEPLVEIGVQAEERDGMLVFFVRDNGIGIEPRHHGRIFGLFDKLDPSSEGTGIGLAIVRRIVEVHGGTIWVESEGGGKGATFCFTLPRA